MRIERTEQLVRLADQLERAARRHAPGPRGARAQRLAEALWDAAAGDERALQVRRALRHQLPSPAPARDVCVPTRSRNRVGPLTLLPLQILTAAECER